MINNLHSWGRYPATTQSSKRLYWRNGVSLELNTMQKKNQTTLAYGLGRSYGDSCLAVSHHVLEMNTLNKWISADWDNGVIVTEAGMTLEDIIKMAIPRGWFLPVSPGTKFVTLGGAIANDVHGKNHHVNGTFGRHIVELGLARSDTDTITCSLHENADFFAATIGGLGLTGIITWAKLQLMSIKSSLLNVSQIRFQNLNEFLRLSSELDLKYDYSVAWIDCFAKKNSLGRGVLTLGNHAEKGPLKVSLKRKWKIPATSPLPLINHFSVKLFNKLYYTFHANKKSNVDYDSFFYPLDSILEWNRIYGPKGFQQFQCVIPFVNAEASIKLILEIISRSNNGSFLSVLKRCGDIKSPGLLSFPIPGITLALDFPEKFSNSTFKMMDDIAHEAGGRLYPAKDAHMQGKHFKKAYPNWEQLEKLRDPAILSSFWQRVTA